MTEERLESLARRYKAAIASRYRALRPGDLGQIPHAPCFVSRKIDGELWLAELHKGKARLFAHGGRYLESGPLLKALATVAANCPEPAVIAGELHVPSTDDGRERVGDVVAALANGNQKQMAFAVFDLVELDGASPPADYKLRLEMLQTWFSEGSSDSVWVLPSEEFQDPGGLREHIQRWVESSKAEGLVVRSSLGEIYKIKPSFSLDAVVVGFTTRVNEADQVRSLLLGLQRGDGSTQLLGACGNLPGDSMRQELLKALEPLECDSTFRHSSSDGSLYRFVMPELVVELSCTDLQTDDSNGDPIRRWVLRHGEQGWQPVVDAVAASMIHPVVVRLRTDKQPDAVDVRLSQLQELLPDLDSEEALEPRQLPPSTLVRRQVWSKEGKGGLAVRKLLVWKSGKEEAWPGWPAWLVHFTDYSPDRKTPLERTLRTALTEADAQAIADALIGENIKKGWTEVAAVPIEQPMQKPAKQSRAKAAQTATAKPTKPKAKPKTKAKAG